MYMHVYITYVSNCCGFKFLEDDYLQILTSASLGFIWTELRAVDLWALRPDLWLDSQVLDVRSFFLQ
jgi:hypothetical protein